VQRDQPVDRISGQFSPIGHGFVVAA
jgi:hypothetical protein